MIKRPHGSEPHTQNGGVEPDNHNARPNIAQRSPDPKIHSIDIDDRQVKSLVEPSISEDSGDRVDGYPGLPHHRRIEPLLSRIRIELFAGTDIVGVTVDEQSVRAVIEDEIGSAAFQSVARADLGRDPVAVNEKRDQIQQNTVLSIL